MSSRDWHEPKQDPLYEQKNIYNELQTRELQIIWEHSISKVPTSAGDGITSKFFDYSTGVTRDGPAAAVGEGEWIQTKEVGDYGGGQPVIAGLSFDINQEPVGDQDAWGGYTNLADGVGFGIRDFDAGEGTPGASEDGVQPYVFFERFGNSRIVVPQEYWNINKLTGGEEGPTLDVTDGLTLRLPHACYFHSNATVEIGVKLQNGGFALVPVHEFNHRGGPMWAKSDLPVQVRTTGTEGNGFEAMVTTVHYEGETGRGVKRLNGEGFTQAKNDGSTLSVPSFPEWQYVMSLRKRAGWEASVITPNRVSVLPTNPCEVQLTVGADLDNTAYALPEDTSDSEGAVEYDIVGWDPGTGSAKGTDTTVNDRGEREFYTEVVGGEEWESPTSFSADLSELVLSGQEPLSMFVRRATSQQTAVRMASMGNGGGF